MPKPPAPLRPLAVSIVVERLKIVLPIAGLAILAVALSPGLALVLWPRPPAPAPQATQESWAVDTRPPLAAFTAMSLRGLPDPDEQRQRRAPCDPDLEQEFNGYCWVPIDVRPCPVGKTWEYKGKCYQRAMRVERPRRDPTSGEPHPAGVADP